MTDVVGAIVLEGADGNPVATATYAIHPGLRERVVMLDGIAYWQNRRESDVWVYRATGEPAGTVGTDDALMDVIRAGTPDYRGPAPSAPDATHCPTCHQRVR